MPMLSGLKALARTTTFRVAVGFAGLFAGFAVLLLGFLYATTVGRLGAEADQGARRELAELTEIWQARGAAGLNMEVIQRAARGADSLYVVITPDGEPLSGNINSAPVDLSRMPRPPPGAPLRPDDAVTAAFSYDRPDPDGNGIERRRARGLFLSGPDGFGLFVARDLGPGVAIADRVAGIIWLGGAGVVAFALVGGFLAARQVAGRVEDLARTTRAVMAGDLSRRAAIRSPGPGAGDEFDALALDLNAMLERIERLVSAARTTGDAIAHDLRSPLTRLRARLETAAADPDAEATRDAVADALAQLDTISATFNAVLRLSRLEAGEGGRLEVTDVSGLALEISELFEPVIEEKGLRFVCEVAPDLRMAADRSLLAQALSNLLDNAVKYTASGTVRLIARPEGRGMARLSVSDTGPGIAEPDRDRAVQRFVRLDAARSLPGAGIGLSLVAAIAEMHGGRLALSDGPDGGGLEAAMLLPVRL